MPTIDGSEGNDSLIGGTDNDTINGLGGVDTLNGAAGDDSIDGGGADDVVTGGGGNDTLQGGDGFDLFFAGPGDDLVDGGAGLDRAAFHGGPAVTVDLAVAGPQDTGQGIKTLVNVENLSGTVGNDTLAGDDGANFLWGYTGGDDSLSGRGGDDLLVVSAGNHTVDGGDGIDTLVASYSLTGGVTVNLFGQGGPQATGQGSVTASNIENLSGTVFNDNLRGDQNANVLAGNKGDDDLGGGDGDDLILGDGEITLTTGGPATLTGSSSSAPAGVPGNDFLWGEGGDDTVIGGGGDDYMAGHQGNDHLDGGEGRDVAAFYLPQGTAGGFRVVEGSGPDAGSYIVERVDGAIVEAVFRVTPTGTGAAIVTGLGSAADQGTDTVSGIEELHFLVPQDPFNPDQFINVQLTPSTWEDTANQNIGVNGGVLNDLIDVAAYSTDKDGTWHRFVNGGAGDDTLIGTAFDENFYGNGGDDLIQGGEGSDRAGFELAPGFTGSLRTVEGSGADAGKLIVQRVDEAVAEDLYVVAPAGGGTFTITGVGAYAAEGTDTVTGVEGVDFFLPGTPVGIGVNLASNPWVYEPNHHVGVDGTAFDDVISLDAYHQDKDASWQRFVNAREGDDSVAGSGFGENLNGEAGADTLSGLGGDDFLMGGAGDDLLQGGEGRDIANFELPSGLAGALRTVAGSGADAGKLILQRVDGAVAEDLFVVGQSGVGTFTVTGVGAYAHLGTDSLQGLEGVSFYVPGGAGFFINLEPSAWVYEPNHHVGVDGTAFGDLIDLNAVHLDKDASWRRIGNGRDGGDTIIGTGEGDNLNGEAGDDSLSGGGGADFLGGGAGDDAMDGGEGDDDLYGAQGADTLSGGGGDDVIVLAPGNLALPRENGDDVIDGGAGFDVVSFWSVPNAVNAALWNQGPQNTGFGVLTMTNVEGLEGGRGDDNLQGDDNDNWFSGGYGDAPTGNDNIFANGGNDVLLGRDGDDYLAGGAGDDYVSGGAGRDISAYHLAERTPGTFRVVQGEGPDAGSLIVERVDGATVEAVFRITPGAAGAVTVTGLNSAASQGTDTVTGVEELHFMVPQDPFNPDQFINVNLAPSAWVYEPNHHVGVNGTAFGDVIDLANFHQDKDATWDRFVNAGDGADSVLGTGLNEGLSGEAGADTLSGLGGDDNLNGGAGSDSLFGGDGHDTASFELTQGLTGLLRTVVGTGANDGSIVLQRVDGAVVEDLFAIAQTAPGAYTVTGLGAHAAAGVDTVQGVESLNFYAPNGPGMSVNLTPNPWVYEPNHHVGVEGTPFGDVIDLTAAHLDKDGTWKRIANGRDGADSIQGTANADDLYGDGGADTLLGGGGDDYMRGGEGSDLIDGGAGANDVAAYSLPSDVPGTFHQVEGAGADAGKLFIERRHEGASERVFEITFTGSGATLEATVTGLNSAADLGTDTVRGVEQLQFVTDPFNPATFTSVQLAPFTPPMGPNAFVNGSVVGETIDFAALYPSAPATMPLHGNARGGNDTIIGHDGPNDLNGGAGDDSVSGRGGDDLLRGGAGRDSFDGGAGYDRVSFYDAFATQGVEADLATGVIANDGYGNTETMTSIEGLGSATRFVDRLWGDDSGNLIMAGSGDFLYGRGGDDIFLVGGAAAVVDGGTGRDTLRLEQSRTMDLNGDGISEEQATSNGVVVDLTQQRVIDDGFGQGGAVVGIEIVAGTASADTLTGDAQANELYGNNGADSVNGVGGDDLLFGGEGNDTLAGGVGVDTALFNGARSEFTVTQVSGGYRVVDNNLANGDEGADELSGVELLQFSDGVLALETGVAISPATVSRVEGNSAVNFFDFTVTRTGDTSAALTLPYTVTGSGADPVDAGDIQGFNGVLNGSVTFAAGASTATIRIPVVGDTTIEGTEQFAVSLSQPASGSVTFVRQVATGTVVNDDNAASIPPGWGSGINFGDPHLVTLDGLQYEMQGVGEFVLIESTRGADVEVQVRTEAVNAYASEISAVATRIGAARVSIDAESDTILVDGQALTFGAGEQTKAVGDGSISLYSENGSNGWLISYSDQTKAAMVVLDLGDRLDVRFAVAPERAGDFRGLLGNYDGQAGNDLALRDGTVLPQPLPFADFYSQFVNDWRISQAESLFDYGPGQSTGAFTDLAFPPAQITLGDFPTDLVAAAEQAARDAGITDPAMLEAAVKDYLLTGDAGFITSSAGADQTVTTPSQVAEVVAPPTALAAVGVGSATPSLDEGQTGDTSYAFKVYRTDGAGTLTVNWSVSGATFEGVDGAADAADFGGTLPQGAVTFADGQLEAIVVVRVSGDTAFEGREGFVFSITAPPGTPVLSGQAQARIVNDDAPPPTTVNTAPDANGDTATVLEDGSVVIDVLANDTDPDAGDTKTLVSVSNTLLGGTARIVDGKVVYTADADVFDLLGDGSRAFDVFTYTFQDAAGATSTATVKVTVNGVGNAPTRNGGNGADTLNGAAGEERMDGGNGNDRLLGLDGADTLEGGNGNDTLSGGDSIDVLSGENGNDVLDGGKGTDSLSGGNGNDTLTGGLGWDLLTGGNGSDRFVFDGAFGRDVITDFDRGADKLVFDDALFSDFADVMAHARQVLGAVVITVDEDTTVTLLDTNLSSLRANDFLFT